MSTQTLEAPNEVIYNRGPYGFVGDETFKIGPLRGEIRRLRGVWYGGPDEFPVSHMIGLWFKSLPILLLIGFVLALAYAYSAYKSGKQLAGEDFRDLFGVALLLPMFISLGIAFFSDRIATLRKQAGAKGLSILISHDPPCKSGFSTSTTKGNGVIMPDGVDIGQAKHLRMNFSASAKEITELIPSGTWAVVTFPDLSGKAAKEVFQAVRFHCNMDRS